MEIVERRGGGREQGRLLEMLQILQVKAFEEQQQASNNDNTKKKNTRRFERFVSLFCLIITIVRQLIHDN